MPGTPGPLVIIGGHEDREGDRTILRAVASHAAGGPLLLLSAASASPEKYLGVYEAAFADLGVTLVPISATEPDSTFQGAGGVFISGGDQKRFMEDVPAEVRESIRALRSRGGVVAGTSAGASVLSEVMLAAGPGRESPDLGDVDLREGLGLLRAAVIDQHFAERGRIGRLVAAVAQRPDVVGIGIDEDTAVIVDGERIEVVGAGSVYLLDVPRAARDAAPRAAEFRLRVLAAGESARLGGPRH
jgi:cyanophycinase